MPMLAICLVVFTSIFGYGVILPIFPFYAERVGAGPEVTTLVIATYTVGQLLGAPLIGRFSDAFGRRSVLIVTLLGGAFSYVILAYAEQLWVIVLSRILAGFMGGNISIGMTYAADVSTEEDRAKAVGLIGASLGMGLTLGPGIGGLIAGPDVAGANLFLPAVVSGALSFVAMLIAIFVLPESLPREERRPLLGSSGGKAVRGNGSTSLHNLVRRSTLVRVSLASGCFFMTMTVAQSILPIWGDAVLGISPRAIGLVFVLMGIATAVTQGVLVGRLCARYGDRYIAMVGCAVTGASLLVMASSDTFSGVALSILLFGAGTGLVGPPLTSLASKEAPAGERGSVMGFYNAIGGIGRVIGPAASGFLYSGVFTGAPFLLGAAGMLLAIAIIWRPLTRNASTARSS